VNIVTRENKPKRERKTIKRLSYVRPSVSVSRFGILASAEKSGKNDISEREGWAGGGPSAGEGGWGGGWGGGKGLLGGWRGGVGGEG